MSIRVSYKLNKAEWDAAYRFAKQIGLPLEQVAKQSLFYAIQDSINRATQMQAEREAVNETTQTNVGGVDTSVSGSKDADTNTLANTQASGAESPITE